MHTYKKATNSMLIVLEAKLKRFVFQVNEGLRDAFSQADRSTLLNVGSPAAEREETKNCVWIFHDKIMVGVMCEEVGKANLGKYDFKGGCSFSITRKAHTIAVGC